MAGIQVHTSSPINSNARSPSRGRDEPAHIAATTTAYVANSAQSAQPGAPAVPAPSAAATAYTPPSPTRTTLEPALTGPPPPQPGQIPQPSEQRGRTMPAAPQPASLDTQAPKYPPPTNASPTSWTPSYRVARPTGQDLSHPPGYMQNHHASFDDRYMEPENKTHTPSPTRVGRGILDGAPLLRNADEGDSGSPIWDTAVSWAKEAGRKLSVVEGEVWKKINGDK